MAFRVIEVYVVRARRVISYRGPVSRWRPGARERLRAAALELFTEQGFSATTVPQITERAGLTTRTFFRHFADKREVLFADEQAAQTAAAMMANAPRHVPPLELILEGLRTIATTAFDGRKAEMGKLRRLVRENEELRERDLRKRASLSEAIRDGFAARGLPSLDAAVYAQVAVVLLYTAIDQWLDDADGRPLEEFVPEVLAALRSSVLM
ncbi:TetR/AcrR family transcriptional regulator [Sinomonas susongensis]|uniref:TetR/AcrR family transcriptional regulator n=1 Tax=Sinomonas susongensis TaxID=1324851 RepID=UPI001FE372D9|nr:TetR/AcrR family transcriptional regulator [Sinomonas susongensis]